MRAACTAAPPVCSCALLTQTTRRERLLQHSCVLTHTLHTRSRLVPLVGGSTRANRAGRRGAVRGTTAGGSWPYTAIWPCQCTTYAPRRSTQRTLTICAAWTLPNPPWPMIMQKVNEC